MKGVQDASIYGRSSRKTGIPFKLARHEQGKDNYSLIISSDSELLQAGKVSFRASL